MLLLDENPPMLPEWVSQLSEIPGNWWVAHTKSRMEKAFGWELLTKKIAFFLPMRERNVVWGGRRRKVLTPLFPSYVFFAGSAEDRQLALRTNRLAQVIPVHQKPQFISELETIRAALGSGVALDFYPSIAVGTRCRVLRGPLQGIEGVVIRKDAVTRLVLQISMLGQAASLEIDPENVEPVA
jgi:transcription antitermination factor NusG